MSIAVMSAVWSLNLPDSQKIVLLALADCANDEGQCWPSMATLSKKCSKGERTVQGVIKALVDAGHLSRVEVPGKGCKYCVHPNFEPKMQGYLPPEFHYVYRIIEPATGDFYVGARTSIDMPEADGYMGSGKWVKARIAAKAILTKEIVETFPTRDALAVGEQYHTQAVFGTAGCMNCKVATPGTLTKQYTPAAAAPRRNCTPQGTAQTPAATADKPSRTINTKPKGKAHAIPDDWKPAEFGLKTKSRAVVDGWPPGELETQVEHFTAHHRARGNQFLDWQDAWSTWVLNKAKFGARNNGKPAPSNDEGPRNPYVRAAVARQAARSGHVVGQPDSWP